MKCGVKKQNCRASVDGEAQPLKNVGGETKGVDEVRVKLKNTGKRRPLKQLHKDVSPRIFKNRQGHGQIEGVEKWCDIGRYVLEVETLGINELTRTSIIGETKPKQNKDGEMVYNQK